MRTVIAFTAFIGLWVAATLVGAWLAAAPASAQTACPKGTAFDSAKGRCVAVAKPKDTTSGIVRGSH